MNDTAPPANSPGMAGAAIAARGLWRPFGAEAGARSILYGDFEVPRGGIVALVGLSGVGKTTLLNMLSGVDRAAFRGEDPMLALSLREGATVDVGTGAPYPRERISIIFQRGYLLSNASVGLNLAIPGTLAGREADAAGLEARLAQVGLDADYRVQRPWQISGGEAQRVGIARALIRDPDIVFADEPTSNLDQEAAERVMTQIRDWVGAAPHRTVVWVSHDLELVARYADHVLVMGRSPAEPGDPAGMRRVSVTGHPRPASVAELHRWKYAGASVPKAEAEATPSAPEALPEGDARRGRIAWRLALSEIFSRRSAFRTTAAAGFAANLHRVTSDWRPGGPGLGGLRALRAFAPFNVFVITTLALLLASAMAAALMLNWQSFRASLEDPRNCHVVVTGGVDAEGIPMALNAATVGALAERPWRGDIPRGSLIADPPPGEEWPRASCATGPAAFGRLDFGRGFVSLPRDGRCTGRGAIPLQMMVGSPNEPILEHAVVSRSFDAAIAPGASILSLSRTPEAAPGEAPPLRFFFGNRQIFLSEYIAAELEDDAAFGARPQVCLEYGGAIERFDVAGIVAEFEAPRTTRYEAFLLDRAMRRMLGDTAIAQNFSETQVYFDPDHLEAARTYLDARGWRYIGDMMDRTASLIASAWNGLLILGAIAVANLVLFVAITYYIASSYLAKNAQSFAVLQSFGLGWGTAARQSGVEMTVTLVLAALPLSLAPVVLALAGPLDLGDFGSLGWADAAAILVGVVLVFAVFAWTAAAWATRRWWRMHDYRSELIA